jgi:Tfp pilus assembly protein PilF
MKRTSINLFATLALAALVASCSGLKKMDKNAADVNYTVTPEVLETHGGKVPVSIKVQVPGGYFDKKAVIEATPVLVYEGGETAYAPYRLQGEKVDGNDKVISYANGGQFTYNGTVDFNENMRVSDLVVRIKASKGTKEVGFESFKIAEGVIATSTMVAQKGIFAALGEDNFQRIIPETKEAAIMFLIQRANLRSSELTKDELKALKEFIKNAQETENKEFKGVDVSAYASPDGPLDLNTSLATQREKVAKSYLEKELKKAKVGQAGDEDFYELRSTPEDWEGFKEMMQNSSIQDKELILRVLSMHSDPEVREREIKNMSETFEVIAEDILPKLRRSKMNVNIEVIGKSDEEIADLAKSNPSELNVEEMLYSATLTEDLGEQLSLYKTAAKQFPKCFRAQNNIGVVLYLQDDLDGAKVAFEKANSLKSNMPEVMNNLGVIALRAGDVAKAEEYFGSAAGAGEELNNNLGVVAIYKGMYDEAVRYFGNSTTCNAALAKILNGNYDAALATLNANTMEVGLKHYLKAVVGARTNDTDLMFDGLRKAVALDGKYKAMASTDMVFGRYFEDATFKGIVE